MKKLSSLSAKIRRARLGLGAKKKRQPGGELETDGIGTGTSTGTGTAAEAPANFSSLLLLARIYQLNEDTERAFCLMKFVTSFFNLERKPIDLSADANANGTSNEAAHSSFLDSELSELSEFSEMEYANRVKVLFCCLYRVGVMMYEGKVQRDDQLVISYFKQICKLDCHNIPIQFCPNSLCTCAPVSPQYVTAASPTPMHPTQHTAVHHEDLGGLVTACSLHDAKDEKLRNLQETCDEVKKEASVRLAYLLLDDVNSRANDFGEANNYSEAHFYLNMAANLGNKDALGTLLHMQHTGQYS